jgi:hypothetical protein
LGLFTGIEQLNENLMPVAVNLKLYSPAGITDLFLAASCGYSVALEKPSEYGMKKAQGGILAGSEAGIIIPVNGMSAIVLAIGYRYNKLNYKLDNWWIGEVERKVTYNRLSVRIGIVLF